MNEEQERMMRIIVSKAVGEHFTWPNKDIENLIIKMIRLYVNLTKEN